MTLVGFKSMTIRIHDESDTIKENENLFKIQGDDSKGATQKVDIKGLAPEVVKGYGSNITYFASRSGVGNPIADYEILDLPFAVREILLGYKKVGKLTFIGDDTKAPYCSILLESEDFFWGGRLPTLEFSKESSHRTTSAWKHVKRKLMTQLLTS